MPLYWFEKKQMFGFPKLLLLLITLRVINSLFIATFFDPDEYWQSMEVAHSVVFGYGYKTWEWRENIALRSYIHPLIFIIYYKIIKALHLDYVFAVAMGPRIIQGILAGLGDYCMYKFVLNHFGSHIANWTLLCQLSNWFLFYCLPRTYSNSLETVLVTAFMCFWPWKSNVSGWKRKFAISLAAVAVLVRPTSAVIWAIVGILYLPRVRDKIKLLTESLWLGIGLLIDRMFYGQWVVAPLNFFKFNIMHNVAVLYGTHPWHWYFTSGITTVLGPFTLSVIAGVLVLRDYVLLIITTAYMVVFSLNAHKEFRFLLPIVPLLLVYSGAFCSYLWSYRKAGRFSRLAKWLVILLFLLNGLMAGYFSMIHQRGTVDVMNHIAKDDQVSSVLFLMPCHSTPFYSYVHRPIEMKILDCQPNLNNLTMPDEADRFYQDPISFIKQNITDDFPSHIVIYDVLYSSLTDRLKNLGFVKREEFFHCHFTSGQRVGRKVLLLARE